MKEHQIEATDVELTELSDERLELVYGAGGGAVDPWGKPGD
jgi:hypothetical protein